MFQFTADAYDASGISSITWYDGNTQIGAGGTLVTMLDVGTHTITARATDASSNSNGATSSPIEVEVVQDASPPPPPDTTPPTITITASGTSGTPVTTFHLVAVAYDNTDDGAGDIAYIIWYDGNDLIGAGSSLSYEFDAGLHVITAVAADAASPPNTSRSNTILIEVESPALPPGEPAPNICR